MYIIDWELDSTGLRSPTINGQRLIGPYQWLPFALLCNELERTLKEIINQSINILKEHGYNNTDQWSNYMYSEIERLQNKGKCVLGTG